MRRRSAHPLDATVPHEVTLSSCRWQAGDLDVHLVCVLTGRHDRVVPWIGSTAPGKHDTACASSLARDVRLMAAIANLRSSSIGVLRSGMSKQWDRLYCGFSSLADRYVTIRTCHAQLSLPAYYCDWTALGIKSSARRRIDHSCMDGGDAE